jgi:hypothetical protein
MKTSIVLGPKMASIDNFQSELRELPRLNVKSLLLRGQYLSIAISSQLLPEMLLSYAENHCRLESALLSAARCIIPTVAVGNKTCA